MTELGKLIELSQRSSLNEWEFTAAAGQALWDASYLVDHEQPGNPQALIEPASVLLSRVVETAETAKHPKLSNNYLVAKNFLAHLALFDTYAQGYTHSPEQVTRTYRELAKIHSLLDPKSANTFVARQADDLTYQMLVSRMADPGHIVYPAPPYASERTFWRDTLDEEYPRTSLFAVAGSEFILPTLVKAVYPKRWMFPSAYRNTSFVELGRAIEFGLKKNYPQRYEDIADMGENAAKRRSIGIAAEIMVDEVVNGLTLNDGENNFLNGVGIHIISMLDKYVRRLYSTSEAH